MDIKQLAALGIVIFFGVSGGYFAGRTDAANHHRLKVDRSGLVVPMKVVRAMDSGWTCQIEINANKYDSEWICK